MRSDAAFALQNMPLKIKIYKYPSVMTQTMPLLYKTSPLKTKLYMFPSFMRQTLLLRCTICPLKIKIYMKPSVKRPNNKFCRTNPAFNLQNSNFQNRDLHVTFFYEMDTAFTFQNMPSENQDLYVSFCYGTRHCLYFEEHSL